MKIKAGLEAEYAEYVKLNSTDDYSKGVIDYTEAWAKLMEEKLAQGETIEACADNTSHEADTDGITGYMYGCAVSALAHFWEYGETLRQWHNLKTQIGNEGEKANKSGGVLNPALYSIRLC